MRIHKANFRIVNGHHEKCNAQATLFCLLGSLRDARGTPRGVDIAEL